MFIRNFPLSCFWVEDGASSEREHVKNCLTIEFFHLGIKNTSLTLRKGRLTW